MQVCELAIPGFPSPILQWQPPSPSTPQMWSFLPVVPLGCSPPPPCTGSGSPRPRSPGGAVPLAVSPYCVQAVAPGGPAPPPLLKVNGSPPGSSSPPPPVPPGRSHWIVRMGAPRSEAPLIPELREKPPVYEKLSCPSWWPCVGGEDLRPLPWRPPPNANKSEIRSIVCAASGDERGLGPFLLIERGLGSQWTERGYGPCCAPVR
jgi:hypothetical protein